MSQELYVGAVQMDIHVGEPSRNIARIASALNDPSLARCALVVFPECSVTGYAFDSQPEAIAMAEPIPGPTVEKMAVLARRHKQHLAYGTLEQDGETLYNACVLVGPDGLAGVYRKTHLPFMGADRFTTPGPTPPPVFDIGAFRVGIHICYDGSFPEASRALMLAGADLAILPTNWPPDAAPFAEHLAQVRAFENFMYFMVVNRVGHEGGFRFIGQSKLCDPFGNTLAEASKTDEDVIVGRIRPELARQKRIIREAGKHQIDRLEDRRVDLYGSLSATYEGSASNL